MSLTKAQRSDAIYELIERLFGLTAATQATSLIVTLKGDQGGTTSAILVTDAGEVKAVGFDVVTRTT